MPSRRTQLLREFARQARVPKSRASPAEAHHAAVLRMLAAHDDELRRALASPRWADYDGWRAAYVAAVLDEEIGHYQRPLMSSSCRMPDSPIPGRRGRTVAPDEAVARGEEAPPPCGT